MQTNNKIDYSKQLARTYTMMAKSFFSSNQTEIGISYLNKAKLLVEEIKEEKTLIRTDETQPWSFIVKAA